MPGKTTCKRIAVMRPPAGKACRPGIQLGEWSGGAQQETRGKFVAGGILIQKKDVQV